MEPNGSRRARARLTAGNIIKRGIKRVLYGTRTDTRAARRTCSIVKAMGTAAFCSRAILYLRRDAWNDVDFRKF